MQTGLPRYFLFSSGIILFITALAKLISAMGTARILGMSDGVILISYRSVFILLGSVELLVSLYCIFGKNDALRTALVSWLALTFITYRIGLHWIGYHMPCSCLGSLTGALHVSPQAADTIMKYVLGYLSIGSVLSCLALFLKRKKLAGDMKERELPVVT